MTDLVAELVTDLVTELVTELVTSRRHDASWNRVTWAGPRSRETDRLPPINNPPGAGMHSRKFRLDLLAIGLRGYSLHLQRDRCGPRSTAALDLAI